MSQEHTRDSIIIGRGVDNPSVGGNGRFLRVDVVVASTHNGREPCAVKLIAF
jgi:hypothetical protein